MFYCIRSFSTSVLPKLKKKHQQTNKKTPPKSTNPPPPKTPEKPDAYILILVVGNQTVLTKTPRVQTYVCVSVYITVLFFLSPIVLFGGYIFPWTTHVWQVDWCPVAVYILKYTHTHPSYRESTYTWMSLYSPIKSFSPPPHKCVTVLQWFKDWPLILRKCIYSHNIQSLDYYKRIASFKH